MSSQFLRGLTHRHRLTLRVSIKCFLVLRDWVATRYHIIALKVLNIFTEEMEHFHFVALFLLLENREGRYRSFLLKDRILIQKTFQQHERCQMNPLMLKDNNKNFKKN